VSPWFRKENYLTVPPFLVKGRFSGAYSVSGNGLKPVTISIAVTTHESLKPTVDSLYLLIDIK
jgi:hypothetical protein